MTTRKKPRYEILGSDAQWILTTKGQPQSSGWLHYELADGTNGLKPPGKWREKLKILK